MCVYGAGKYKVGAAKPYGPRAAMFSDNRLQSIQPLLSLMEAIATERGKTLSQVCDGPCNCSHLLKADALAISFRVVTLTGRSTAIHAFRLALPVS